MLKRLYRKGKLRMNDRPLLLFPHSEKASRNSLGSFVPRGINRPTPQRQIDRLSPTFQVLSEALENKRISMQSDTTGIEPEFALVFEVIGSVESFYTAVKHVEGFEWMFDLDTTDIEPDDDFSFQGEDEDENLNGIVYCIMTNQQALEQLLSLWTRHSSGETEVFQKGFAGLRNVFLSVKSIRRWDASDRIRETKVMDYWIENLEIDGRDRVSFEIELFYRSSEAIRQRAYSIVQQKIEQQNGRVLNQCLLNEIDYHGMLVEMPRHAIQQLVDDYENIELAKVDDIMFFRPRSQSMTQMSLESYPIEETDLPPIENEEPIVALFDGMPIQNHHLLNGRLIVDDPDNVAERYVSKYRVHGTAMSSLIIHGDLSSSRNPIKRPVYVRPILEPEVHPFTNELICETTPKDVLLIDLIHRSVKRLFSTSERVAPSIKVINLSIGDKFRQFAQSISPLARLLDWLSYKYNVLFLISAGNQNTSVLFEGISFDDFSALSIDERTNMILTKMRENQRNLKVLSPAESINSLTIGALFMDAASSQENQRNKALISDYFPSPYSGIGYGYKNIITPDLFYFGGRKLIKQSTYNGNIEFNTSSSEPGCKVAAPFNSGTESGYSYTFGTSDATAQMCHESNCCYDITNEIYVAETGNEVPPQYAATILKAILTHGASWDQIDSELAECMGISPKKLGKWLGNGIPDISKVEQCTQNRVTLIGTGTLKKGEAHVYDLPLPFDFSSRLISRKLTATLAYFSPINTAVQKYKGVNVWFEIVDGANLVPNRNNTDWQRVRKGTLQHEIFTGDSAEVWDDDSKIKIKVNCKEEAITKQININYALVLSFEAAFGVETDIYETVANRIKAQVPVSSRV